MSTRKLMLAAMLAVCGLQMGCASITAEEINARDGRLIIVAEKVIQRKPGAIDVAYSRPGSSGQGGQITGAAMGGGAGAGGSILAGLVFDAATTPSYYDSRIRWYKVIREVGCKPTSGLARANKASFSVWSLTPGVLAEKEKYDDLPSMGLRPITGKDGKSIAKIDASHPCFAAYEAAVRKHAEEKLAAEKLAAEKQAKAQAGIK
jgi:hypothetical protein